MKSLSAVFTLSGFSGFKMLELYFWLTSNVQFANVQLRHQVPELLHIIVENYTI